MLLGLGEITQQRHHGPPIDIGTVIQSEQNTEEFISFLSISGDYHNYSTLS